MTLSESKKYYSRFLEKHQGKLHFAAHSHHFWPDVSREAQLAYWDDCALLSDEKWGKIFSEVIPKTQKHLVKMLNLKNSNQIALAPNTHELTSRLLSLFLGRSSLKILTSSNEFYSWKRQFLRLQELTQVTVHQVNSADFLTERKMFIENFKAEMAKKYDVVFISQVFFDSAMALTDDELLELSLACPKESLFVIDGYHGFAAIPTDLSRLEGRVFYLGGGYKYAQAGEGVGFMVVPNGKWRPAYTGWFAEYALLSKPPGAEVGYSSDAMAFMGATQDPSGFYRFNAVWDLFEKEKIQIKEIHQYVVDLQKTFLKNLSPNFVSQWKLKPLFQEDLNWHGHFLTFDAPDLTIAENCHKALENAHIYIDRRGTRLRFGFGLYQDQQDVLSLLKALPYP